MKNCPSCHNQVAIIHVTLGLLPCIDCQTRQDKLPSPREAVEIIPEYIKEERKERSDSIAQPHIKGEANKKYIDLWGADALRDRGFSEKEIKNAKYVYDGLRTKNTAIDYYKDST